MTAEMLPGPPCDVCGEEPAAMSLLNYADYQQLKMGVNCAPGVLRGIAHSIDGQGEPEPEPETVADPELSDAVPTAGKAAAGAAAAEGEDEPGSARDHWASTTHVRRSTHGHRTPRGATGKPQPQPEQAGD